MSNSNLSTKTPTSSSSSKRAIDNGTVEVLYQKMGDRWFAFSLVGDEVFVGSLTEEEIAGNQAAIAQSERLHPISGNS
jgi:hypothetical protein